MKIDFAEIQKRVDARLLTVRRHPTEPLMICDYTRHCQYSNAWDDITRLCRGLIINEAGEVICRPFPKFFNLNEHKRDVLNLQPINWKQDFYVSEKLDGSMGILYPIRDGHCIATRGSFVSPQAKMASQMWAERHSDFKPLQGRTYLFEIIYPEKRVVLDYGDRRELVLLDVIDNETGRGLSRDALDIEGEVMGCTVAKCFRGMTEESLVNLQGEENQEGVVVRFEDGTRIKIKLAEYSRLFKLMTGVNARDIWEAMSVGESLDKIIDRVPDEFYQWVEETRSTLQGRFDDVMIDATKAFESLYVPDRKEFAANVAGSDYKDRFATILFCMFDKSPCDKPAWKLLRPEASAPFTCGVGT